LKTLALCVGIVYVCFAVWYICKRIGDVNGEKEDQ
jgi:nitrate/nitrite transporter NarK